MSSYKNFQSNNVKHSSQESRSVHNPDFMATVESMGLTEGDAITRNIDKYVAFASWMGFYPDLFLDLIRPEEGGITLHLDQRVFLRIALRFFSLYGVFPRGWSKCVAGDTLLFTDEGIKPIGDYFNHNTSGKELYTNHSINMINKFGELENSNRGVYSGFKDTKIIATEEGYSIEGTLNHPILVMNNSGMLEFRNTEDIKIGDYVAINRHNNIWGNKTAIDINALETWYASLSKQSQSHINKRELPDKLNEDIALLIGYLLGDGCMTLNNNILFSNNDEDIINNAESIFYEQFGLKMFKQKGDNVDYIVRDKYLRKYFEVIGLTQVNSHNKVIPDLVMRSPKNIVARVISGLFDTDGSVDSKSVSYCSVSDVMVKQVQLILLNFGIISRVTKKHNGRFSHNVLFIYGENIDKFYQHIGFSSGKKQKKLKEISGKKRNTNKDIIPHNQQLVVDFYKDAKKYNKYLYDELYHIMKGNNALTYKKLEYLINLKNAEECSCYNELHNHYERNYFYSKVSRIADSQNHVYDLQMPNTNSFVSNGFVSHNTYLEVLAMFIVAIRYPGIELALTAQTKQNASELLKDKFKDITKHYPLLKNEVFSSKFSKDDAEILFTNNSRIDILANSSSSKGQRRRRINVEESCLIDSFTFEDSIKPIVEVPRYTIGKLAISNPEELNQQINFFTTAGFRASDEYSRLRKMIENMANLDGEMVLGSDWRLGCWYGRGSTKSQMILKKKDMSPIAFAQNFQSKWCGAVDNALIEINKLLNLRVLKSPQNEAVRNGEYVLGIDVARSADTGNNQSSVAVLEIKRNKKSRVTQIPLVNLYTISNALNFTAQAVEIKRIKRLFDAKIAILDTNGLGVGLCDELMKESFDPITGESLGCWDTVNTDAEPEIDGAERCLYDLKVQSTNSDIIVSFIDMVESGKLKLLVKKQDMEFTIHDREQHQTNVLPFVQTDFLIEEIANLQLKTMNNGKLGVEKVIRKHGKDRFSALMYGLWYVKTFEDNVYSEEIDPYDALMAHTCV